MIFGTMLFLFVALMAYIVFGRGLDRNSYAKYKSTTQTLNPSFNFVSQAAHFAWGYIFVTFPSLIILRFAHRLTIWELLTIVAVAVAVTGGKEYWDAHGLETPEIAGNSWVDFWWWSAGIGLGALVASTLI
jgi:hypothetical protein